MHMVVRRASAQKIIPSKIRNIGTLYVIYKLHKTVADNHFVHKTVFSSFAV